MDDGTHHLSLLPQHNDAALAAWLPKWWNQGRAWQQPPAEPENPEEPYHGQDEEDRHLLDHYFHGKMHGTYLEMGALDGVLYSNTLHLQKAHGWRGVLIEAAPDMYAKMVVSRPHDIGINAAICDLNRWVHFSPGGAGGTGGVGGPATAGIYEFMNDAFREQWHSKVDPATLQLIPCMPLSSILSKFGVTEIDFWSLDVEGAELQVLQTFDFSSVRINVVCIEADGHNSARDQEVIELMQSHGNSGSVASAPGTFAHTQPTRRSEQGQRLHDPVWSTDGHCPHHQGTSSHPSALKEPLIAAVDLLAPPALPPEPQVCLCQWPSPTANRPHKHPQPPHQHPSLADPNDVVEGAARHIQAHHAKQPEERTAMTNWLPGWWSSELSKWQEYPSEHLEPDHPYHGQDNEDQYAAEFFFHNKKHGTYLEMGGYDGLTFTNTLYLNKALGWRGMLIEASPQQYYRMIGNRKDDIGLL
ncbi:hypothetical protein WJX74_004113, partial [Apatococcus lobatus]